jgi:hypothetical protein
VPIEEDGKNNVLTCFCHPFCAMSFPEHFKTNVTQDHIHYSLKDNSLRNPLLLNKKEKDLS